MSNEDKPKSAVAVENIDVHLRALVNEVGASGYALGKEQMRQHILTQAKKLEFESRRFNSDSTVSNGKAVFISDLESIIEGK